MSRTLTPKDLAYESIANDFENYISDFDTARRLEVPVHTLLGGTTVRGMRVPEGGFGLGVFTRDLLRCDPALEWAQRTGLVVLKTTGIHSIPWHVSHSLVEALDGWFGSHNYSFAVNLAILARKPPSTMPCSVD
jgi:hypothetical protein